MIRISLIAICLFSTISFSNYDDVSVSVNNTIESLLIKLKFAKNRSGNNKQELKSIEDDINSLRDGKISDCLIRTSKIYERIRLLDKKNYVWEDGQDALIKSKKIIEIVLRKSNINSRIAVLPFGKKDYTNSEYPVKNFELAKFNTMFRACFENKKRMIVAGNDLLDVCRDHGIDLGPVSPKNFEGITRFLKKTKMDMCVSGVIEDNYLNTFLVYADGRFEVLDDFILNQDEDDYLTKAGLNDGNIQFWFEMESEGSWNKIELIEDVDTNRSKGLLYLPLPNSASKDKIKIRIVIKNKGASIQELVKKSKYGRLLGASITIDGIDLFLKDGKGLATVPGQGRKLLVSPPNHAIKNINGNGFAIKSSDNDESLLKIEGFLDSDLKEERGFFVGVSDDSFATQFLGTDLKPLGFITLNFYFQELAGDFFRAPLGLPAIGALPPRKADIEVLKVDFYDDLPVSYVVAYKTITEINNLIPKKNQRIFKFNP